MKKERRLWLCGLMLLLLAAVTAYFYSRFYLQWNVPLYGAAMAAIFLEGAATFALLSRAKGESKKRAVLFALLGGVLYDRGLYTQADPTGLSAFTPVEITPIDDADLYISPDGSDENDGSFTHPLATIEKARELVRAMDKTGKSGVTVAFKAGEYPVRRIAFTSADGGTAATPVSYDDRSRDGVLHEDSWFKHSREGGGYAAKSGGRALAQRHLA